MQNADLEPKKKMKGKVTAIKQSWTPPPVSCWGLGLCGSSFTGEHCSAHCHEMLMLLDEEPVQDLGIRILFASLLSTAALSTCVTKEGHTVSCTRPHPFVGVIS